MIKKIKNISINKKAFPVKGVLISALGVMIFGLALYNSRDVIFGTPLNILATKDGSTLQEQFLPISGMAKHARTLQINGREVSFDRNGNFNDGVLLSPGYNVVEVSLKDQFGKQKTKVYHLVLSAPPAVAQVENNQNLYQ